MTNDVRDLLETGFPAQPGPWKPWHDGIDLDRAIDRACPGLSAERINTCAAAAADRFHQVMARHHGTLITRAMLHALHSDLVQEIDAMRREQILPGGIAPALFRTERDSVIRLVFRVPPPEPVLTEVTIAPKSLAETRYDAAREHAKAMTLPQIDDALNRAAVPEAIRDEIMDRLITANDAAKAIQPFAVYLAARDAKPLGSIGDVIHHIHVGTEYEAELTLTHVRTLVATQHKPKGTS